MQCSASRVCRTPRGVEEEDGGLFEGGGLIEGGLTRNIDQARKRDKDRAHGLT